MRLIEWVKRVGIPQASATLVSLFVFTACASSTPVKSLCELDFLNKMCWVDKGNKEGFSFKAMETQQIECAVNPNIPCLYSIDSYDLNRIYESLD